MKKIVAVYKDAMLGMAEHSSFPRSSNLSVYHASFVLYEISHRPWYNFFRLTYERKFDYFAEKSAYQYEGNWKNTDLYLDLILPWQQGVDLNYLDGQLKMKRDAVWPRNPFIYKAYDEQTSVPTHT